MWGGENLLLEVDIWLQQACQHPDLVLLATSWDEYSGLLPRLQNAEDPLTCPSQWLLVLVHSWHWATIQWRLVREQNLHSSDILHRGLHNQPRDQGLPRISQGRQAYRWKFASLSSGAIHPGLHRILQPYMQVRDNHAPIKLPWVQWTRQRARCSYSQ